MVKAALICMLLAGCAPRIVYTPVQIDLPPRPSLYDIKRSEFGSCVSGETYVKYTTDIQLLLEYAEILESRILSTHK